MIGFVTLFKTYTVLPFAACIMLIVGQLKESSIYYFWLQKTIRSSVNILVL